MQKVIFDTDPGVDDAMALLFLHRHPEIQLVGITTVFGNATVDLTTRNALFLKKEYGIEAPVARGENRTIDPGRIEAPWPTYVHGANGLGDIAVPETVEGVEVAAVDAVKFIIDTVRAKPNEITLVAVGRMTNLGRALQVAPEIAGLVKQVVIMGGSFYVPGNVNPAAEANIHGDPEAADLVFTAKWPVVIVPLDVTSKTAMPRVMLDRIASKGGAAARRLRDLSQNYIEFYSHIVNDGMLVHDSCACVYLVAPQLFVTKRGAVRVACKGLADGQTILRPEERRFPANAWDGMPTQTVCIGAEADAVLSVIEQTLMSSSVF